MSRCLVYTICHCCHTCCGKLIAFLQNKLGYWNVTRPSLSMQRGGNIRLVCAELATRVLIQVGNSVFLANSVYSFGKSLRSDIDNVPFCLNNAEFNCHESAKRRFLVRKLVNLFCFCLYAVQSC